MIRCAVFLVTMCMVVASASGGVNLPGVAVHIEKHADRSCDYNLPTLDEKSINNTYDGVGKIDAFVVFTHFGEAKGASFGLTWPEAWGRGTWNDCSHLKIADITSPGDVTSILWKDCVRDSVPLIAGWLTVTVTAPGTIDVIASTKQRAIAVANCNEIAPEMFEVIVNARGGAGGAKGDDITALGEIINRNWFVRPDSSGDTPTIDEAIRRAMPGDTIFVAGGRYRENLVLRQGVVLLGSWDSGFRERDLDVTPSLIDAQGFHYGVKATFGEDSTTVLDGFVIAGASGKAGGGIAISNSSSPILRNLVIHSNSATYGGGISCRGSSPLIQDVLIIANSASSGGGIHCSLGSSPLISNATIVANGASHGGGIFALEGSSPYVENSIIANHANGHGVFVADGASRVSISCCDLWSNLPTDFGGQHEKGMVLRDNIFEDPQFADPDQVDFTLTAGSPARGVEGCGRLGSVHATIPEP